VPTGACCAAARQGGALRPGDEAGGAAAAADGLAAAPGGGGAAAGRGYREGSQEATWLLDLMTGCVAVLLTVHNVRLPAPTRIPLQRGAASLCRGWRVAGRR